MEWRNILYVPERMAHYRETVTLGGIDYQVDPPHQGPGYYAIEIDDDAKILRLVPTQPDPGDDLPVQDWDGVPKFRDEPEEI